MNVFATSVKLFACGINFPKTSAAKPEGTEVSFSGVSMD